MVSGLWGLGLKALGSILLNLKGNLGRDVAWGVGGNGEFTMKLLP